MSKGSMQQCRLSPHIVIIACAVNATSTWSAIAANVSAPIIIAMLSDYFGLAAMTTTLRPMTTLHGLLGHSAVVSVVSDSLLCLLCCIVEMPAII